MPNCKPGDLAIIHGLTKDTEHNGKIVTVEQYFPDAPYGPVWIVQPETYTSRGRDSYREANLKPIRGTGKPQAVTHQTSDKQTA